MEHRIISAVDRQQERLPRLLRGAFGNFATIASIAGA